MSLATANLPGVGLIEREPTLDEYQAARFAAEQDAKRYGNLWMGWPRLLRVIRMKQWQKGPRREE